MGVLESFREFLEWFERSGVVWSILNDFIILEFSENFRVFGVVWGVFGEDWRSRDRLIDIYGLYCLNMVVYTVIL